MFYLPTHIPSDSGFADSAFGFGPGIKKRTDITFCGFLYSQKLQDTKCDTADLYKISEQKENIYLNDIAVYFSEGLNTVVKLAKRVVFGYQNFYRTRKRLLGFH